MSFRKLKISFFVKDRKAVPKILLSGEWLKKAGFEVGQNITLEIINSQIIIKNAD